MVEGAREERLEQVPQYDRLPAFRVQTLPTRVELDAAEVLSRSDRHRRNGLSRWV